MSGRATTAKTTEYSVISTGLIPVNTISNARKRKTSQETVKRGAFFGSSVATPLPAEELGEVVGGGEARVDRRAADAEHHAAEGEQQAGLAERSLRRESDGAEVVGLDPERVEQIPGDDHQGAGEDTAER